MKTFNAINPRGVFGRVVTTILLMLSLGVVAPLAHAAVSGNATIFNEATVSYTSGLATLTASDDVSVTVITLAAAPTVTVNTTAQTIDASTTADYIYTVRSNSNGSDTYTVALNGGTSLDTDVSAQGNAFSLNPVLWGGIVIDSPAANTIRLPGGSVSGLVAGVSTVEVFDDNLSVVGRFTVTTITPGNAQTTVPSDEVLDTLVLTEIAPTVAFGAGDILAGTQVGEYTTTTMTLTAGNPTTPGTDGVHVSNLSFTTTATDIGGSPVVYVTSGANEVTTTVNSPAITIQKLWRNVSTVTTFAAPGPGAKPGEVIEYQITVTGDPSATVTDVYLTDDFPTYTARVDNAYGAGQDVRITYTDAVGANDYDTYHTYAGGLDTDQAWDNSGTLIVTVGFGAGDANIPTGGTFDANDDVVVLFQVTVQ